MNPFLHLEFEEIRLDKLPQKLERDLALYYSVLPIDELISHVQWHIRCEEHLKFDKSKTRPNSTLEMPMYTMYKKALMEAIRMRNQHSTSEVKDILSERTDPPVHTLVQVFFRTAIHGDASTEDNAEFSAPGL
jgi:hypothetical protein